MSTWRDPSRPAKRYDKKKTELKEQVTVGPNISYERNLCTTVHTVKHSPIVWSGIANGRNGLEWDRSVLQINDKQKGIPGLINTYIHASLRSHLSLAIDISEFGARSPDTRRSMLIQGRLICVVP